MRESPRRLAFDLRLIPVGVLGTKDVQQHPTGGPPHTVRDEAAVRQRCCQGSRVKQFDRLYGSKLSSAARWRVAVAVVVACAAAYLAWLGIVWRAAAAAAAAGPWDNPVVRFGVPAVLAAMLVAAAWLLRGVILARLQVAVLLSLLLHLLLLVLLQELRLPAVLAQELFPHAESPGHEAKIALPDYGGMESVEATPEMWQMSPSLDLPANQAADAARQAADAVRPREQRRDVAMTEAEFEAAERERQQREQMKMQSEKMPQDSLTRAELERPEMIEAAAEAPELAAERAVDVSIEAAAKQQKRAAEMDRPDREMAEQQLPQIDRSVAMRDTRQGEVRPRQTDLARREQSRARSEVRASDVAADAPSLAPAARSQESRLDAAASSVDRRDASVSARSAGSQGPALADARSSSANVRSARSESAPRVNSGASASMARSRSQSGPQAASDSAEAPEVTGGSAPAGAVRVEAASGSAGRSGRSTLSSVAGLSSGGSSAPASSVGASGSRTSGTGAMLARVSSEDGTGRAAAPGGGGSAAIARGSVSGGVTGATGSGESVTIGETRGSGDVQVAASSAASASGSGRGTRAAVPSGRSGSGTGASAGGSDGGVGLSEVKGRPSGGGASGGAGEPARGVELAPRLSSDSGGGRPSAGLPGRATSGVGSPLGVTGGIEAEAMALSAGPQGGGAIEPGPQASGGGGGGKSGSAGVASIGPRATTGRRAAGLPGSTSAAGGAGSPPALGDGVKLTVGAPARRTSESGGTIETHPLVAKLARQAGGDLGSAARAEISPEFSLRTGEMRRQAARSLGGSPDTERAVELGIAWLAAHQAPDGSWSIHEFSKQCKEHTCDGLGSFQSDTAATGLALLALLGAGYTHESGQYADVVGGGLKWLIGRQRANGDLFHSDARFLRFYSHGIATIALAEAYGMTRDSMLREPTEKALQFIIDSQHPQLGGWRYEPRTESDTSVSGWQLMALKSGGMAGFTIPPAAYQRVTGWLDSVQRGPGGGQYSYHPTKPESIAMTAEGLLMRQYLGFGRDNPRLRAGADELDRQLPDLAQRDVYYWYYATQVMYHMQGTHWDRWNGRIRDILTNTQSRDPGVVGSWSPTTPTPDRWGAAGGRVYETCMHLLMLEVYYRHLPLYQHLEK